MMEEDDTVVEVPVSGSGNPLKESDAWGVEVLRKILGVSDGIASKPVESTSMDELLEFQYQLMTLADTPKCFVHAHPRYGHVNVDFGKDGDKDAAIELTTRVKGVSRWKPNLVPRLVTELQFFSNFFGHVVGLADFHFSDDKALKQFYADVEDEPKQQQQQQQQSTVEVPTRMDGSGEPIPNPFTAPTVPKAASPVPPAAVELTIPEPAQSLTRFSKENAPKGCTNDDLLETFLDKKVLFYIGKSDNKNTVVYEANLLQDNEGKYCFNENNPVHPYWIMYEKGASEEELNMLERNTAYGSTCTPIQGQHNTFVVQLSALKEKPIQVSVDPNGTLHAKARIGGKVDELISVFVQTSSNWMGMPTVDYVDVTGKTQKERITK